MLEFFAGLVEGLGIVFRLFLFFFLVSYFFVFFVVVMLRVYLRIRCGLGFSFEVVFRGILCENDGGWFVGSYFLGVFCLM